MYVDDGPNGVAATVAQPEEGPLYDYVEGQDEGREGLWEDGSRKFWSVQCDFK